MNHVVKYNTLLIFSVAMFAATSAFSQEWSAQQKDVWKNVQTYWDLAAKGDLEAFLTYYHQDFSGWMNGSYLPQDKATREKFNRFDFARIKTLFQDIKPLAIKIHGNIAIVHYTYTQVSKSVGDEKEKTEQGRWTDILMQQENKWVMIGDSGGSISGN